MTRFMHKNRPGFRFCNKCDTEYELTTDNFHRDANRLYGFAYHCRSCASKKRDTRTGRWGKMTAKQKANKKRWARGYIAEGLGRASYKIGSYRAQDKLRGHECDLTREWFAQNIMGKPCFYCDDTKGPIGCDRIDNSIGHTRANVVPCCWDCNSVRMDRFSHREMMVIGKTLADVKRARQS